MDDCSGNYNDNCNGNYLPIFRSNDFTWCFINSPGKHPFGIHDVTMESDDIADSCWSNNNITFNGGLNIKC